MKIGLSALFVSVLLLMPANSRLHAHGLEHFGWVTLTASGLHDFGNDYENLSMDLNMILLIFNGGLSYEPVGFDNEANVNFNIGIGLGPVFQIQYVLNNHGSAIRGRSDFLLGYYSKDFSKEHPAISLITLTIQAGKNFYDHNQWFVGIGIGFSCNLSEGLEYFK